MPDRFFSHVMDHYARLATPMQPNPPQGPLCHHCANRLVGSEYAALVCEHCGLPLCQTYLDFFKQYNQDGQPRGEGGEDFCPIDADWSVQGPIGPRPPWQRTRSGERGKAKEVPGHGLGRPRG